MFQRATTFAAVVGGVALVWGALAASAVAQRPIVGPNPNPNPNNNVNFGSFGQQVGGVSIDARGALKNAAVDAMGQLAALRAKMLGAAPGDLGKPTPQRKVSLRGLQAAIRECNARQQPFTPEMLCLAGLQRIEYVLVYPEQNDIVLVGPADGWRVDARGNVVGATNGKPIMLLDDLIVALRAAGSPNFADITCSIDPTKEGLEQLRRHVAKLRNIGSDPKATAAGIEKALGQQTISVTGVPAESRFAHVLVAADYRMKRLAMNFEPAPVKGLPSFLEMAQAGAVGINNMLPRWWLAADYKPLARDAEGLAWQLRGAAVKTMTESDFLAKDGHREHTGKADHVAQKWADNMTAKYAELSVADPIFGQLQNCMDLAIVAALVADQKLEERAGLKLDELRDRGAVPTATLAAPKLVDSQSSLLKKRSNWLISVSGGVRINPKTPIQKAERATTLGPIRDEAKLGVHKNWWWN